MGPSPPREGGREGGREKGRERGREGGRSGTEREEGERLREGKGREEVFFFHRDRLTNEKVDVRVSAADGRNESCQEVHPLAVDQPAHHHNGD